VTGDDPQWIPPKKAAEKLGVSTRTLLRMADTDAITVIVLPSGHHRYDAQQIDRLAAEATHEHLAADAAE
jgi:predicted site-specific integrase-resolvase